MTLSTRRAFARAAGAAAALAVAPPASSTGRTPPTLTFSHFLPADSFFQTDLVEPWARALEARVRGRLRVRIVSGDDPTGDVAMQSTHVRQGVVDIALGIRGAEAERFPGSSLVESPALFEDAVRGSVAFWRLYRSGLLDREYAPFKVLALFSQNPAGVHTSRRRVVEPADMAGLRLRAPNPVAAEILEALGAKPSILQFRDVMGPVASGALDGVVTNWGNPLPHFETRLRHHTEAPLSGAAFFIVMNKARHAALPRDVRDAVDALSGEPWARAIGELWNKWDKAVRDRAIAAGGEIIRPDPAATARWRSALTPVTHALVEDLRERFPHAREAHRRLVAVVANLA